MNFTKTKELNRRHLTEMLSGVMQKPAAFVVAPSGYGKTTVVRAFLDEAEDIQYIWLSMGREEVDEVWVWKKLCNEFDTRNQKVYEQMKELGLPGTVREVECFLKFVRENLRGSLYVVLDDFHECKSQAINHLLTRLIYEEIPGLHLILISCFYPELPYEEMLLRGYCVLLNQQMLMLTEQETVQIFEMNQVKLKEEELNQIMEFTGGWISAVYLFLLDYMENGYSGRFLSVTHLMKTAIFDKLSEQIRIFCMKMSLFESFTLEEAVYITQDKTGLTFASDFMNEIGFIQYEKSSGRYQMHMLLRSAAIAELKASGIAAELLYERSGEWCEKNRDFIKAIINYRKAGKDDRILKLLSGDMRNVIFEEAPAIVKEFFEALPLNIRALNPIAYLCFIYYIIMKENACDGAEMFYEIKREYECSAEVYGLNKALRGELLILEAILYFNDLTRINEMMQQAYELLDQNPSNLFRQTLLTYGTPNMTMLYYRKEGTLKETIEQEKLYAQYHMRLVGRGKEGWDDYFDAEYALETGRVDEAEVLVGAVCEKARFRKQSCIIISSYYILLRCLIYKGKEKEFYQKMKEFEQQMKETVRPILQIDYELAYSYLYGIIGRNDRIVDWIRSFDIEKCGRLVRNSRVACIIYGLALINSEQWILLDTLAEQIMVPYESTLHLEVILYAYMFKAIACHKTGFESKALEYLDKALNIAERDNLKMIFLEQSRELLPVMGNLQLKGTFRIHLKKQMKQYELGLKNFSKARDKVVLTGREKEIMELVRAGYRNSDIGKKMNIALVTVEKNLTSIYRKMNVSNRAAAIARLNEEL